MVLNLGILQFAWRDIVDIVVVAFIIYRVIILVKGTRAVSVFYGLLLLLVIFYFSGELGLYTLHWLLANFLGSLFLVIIILFQRDIRKALAEMGGGRLWFRSRPGLAILDELILASITMAKKRIGALMVIEKTTPLGDVVESGVEVDSKFSKEIVETIFYPNTPLHDGAVIIRDDKILAAGCILPLAVGIKSRWDYGTRHRAALGITEETDAIAIVVSEERGVVSVAIGGKLIGPLDEVRLRRVLSSAWEK
ncbi:diadenylate cyclase CdaA [Desulfonatronovibrio magnus]|uniref:diadenylate cyclase CdaA n=1 Tax=Desulfonatronovibrio magnus TaxID=698827 RepID=UPI0005EB623B|nr:diadenylate cyclase CdaA [Desulfonatronovibrio magnus]